ncbi:MAG: SDR family NAD(P)-dependent oxidoreductase [Xanthomonadales bacterium]|nr:SDR family NAD(P)-dependent oxidoreductase [Gammaproteobacteria bacterium]MBT8056773.1 SDR family NAD(P)-dependent oxidoreductase [Gammaproteobacteria bacterium]NNJ77882.1 SDR family NAD(P)-dependent oxidoreductase [Xanthomonadales bacterium]NNL04463.1 SDR family NAD(P)-dependent oxidoreductase [Xanthomonadales bacterium]
MTSPSMTNSLMDRLILPGAAGFTRFGYAWRKRGWTADNFSMEGRTVIVTGATSGLGLSAARSLAKLGARVVLVGRNPEKGERARQDVIAGSGNEDVSLQLADLGLMSEVRDLAARLLESEKAIHVLVNNAAVLPAERSETDEGLEHTFATDLLSPYLLTELLLPRLKACAPSRIVNVLSGGMYLSGLEVDDLEYENGDFDGSRAYARAKRALMVLTEQWAEELEGSGVVVNAMHPGWADTPGVEDSLPGFYRLMRPLLRSPEQGADTIAWLAAAPSAAETSGRFYLDREPHVTTVLPGTAGTARQRARLRAALEAYADRSAT